MVDKQAWNWANALKGASEDSLGAFISVMEPGAEESIENTAPLAGMPYAVKDNIDTVALPTTANTPALVGSTRVADHEVVTRLQAAGAQLVGKTNLHELAFGITTGAAAYPATRNPFDPSRSAGGSSGGSGAAVGAGIVPVALGTDTGGSISIPAAWCGVYGYRPTIGRWPDGGAAPLSKTRDAVGVIAESLHYLALVDEVVRDHGTDVSLSKPLRIGIPRHDSEYLTPLAEDVQQVWDHTLQRIQDSDQGIELLEIDTSQLHALDAACGMGIVLYESVRDLSAYLAGLPTPLSFEQVLHQAAAEDVQGILAMAWEQREHHAEYQQLMVIHQQLVDAWDQMFRTHQVVGLLRPTTPITATPVGDEFTTSAFGEDVPTFGTVIRNTGPGSTAGQPAITLPAGIGSAGLPVGVTLDGKRGHDDALFAVAQHLDAIVGVRSPLLA